VRSRLEDLIATAERQLASRSYDAAVDTYRTALSEPGAAEAGVAERLDAACRVRDEARGIVRPVEAPAPPLEVAALLPPLIEIAAAPTLVPLEIASPPAPVPQPVERFRTIEPPTFRLLEPDEAEMMERCDRRDFQQDIEKLSIIDPKPPPEERDPLLLMRVAIAALIFVFVCLIVLMLK
jgi:hypothetical protein